MLHDSHETGVYRLQVLRLRRFVQISRRDHALVVEALGTRASNSRNLRKSVSSEDKRCHFPILNPTWTAPQTITLDRCWATCCDYPEGKTTNRANFHKLRSLPSVRDDNFARIRVIRGFFNLNQRDTEDAEKFSASSGSQAVHCQGLRFSSDYYSVALGMEWGLFHSPHRCAP